MQLRSYIPDAKAIKKLCNDLIPPDNTFNVMVSDELEAIYKNILMVLPENNIVYSITYPLIREVTKTKLKELNYIVEDFPGNETKFIIKW